jgi:26S proteasome regulatory subunit T4
MDEIDAIGGRRFSEGSSADREVQRTLMELLNQLDGFDELGKVFIFLKNILFYFCQLSAYRFMWKC